MIDAFTFVQNVRSRYLEITRGDRSLWNLTKEQTKLTVILGQRDLECVKGLLFRYYKDGIAEVDHIDVETPNGDYIVFTMEDAVAPLSATEARRRLGQ
jgi:hypothetical protein